MIPTHHRISIKPESIAELARPFKEALNKIVLDNFTDPRYYPPAGTEDELVLRYFIFMVAIDHRTSRYGPFEGYVDGEFYHGADLLYRLGMKKFEEDPSFFSPSVMSRISTDDVKSWLTVTTRDGRKISIWDPAVRASLLRDLGSRIMRYYEGNVTKLLRVSGERLKNPYTLGLIDRMKAFIAYSDPVEKKPYLYVKFISRRGLFKYVDAENSEVPVDNHLVRIALRLGLVDMEERLQRKIKFMEEFSWEEDVTLRFTVRAAYKLLARVMNIDPLVLDDFLWLFGRHCCTRVKPICVAGCEGKCAKLGLCVKECPFVKVCPASKNPEDLVEHNYQNTYYY